MKKALFILCLSVLTYSSIFAQNVKIKKVSYSKTEIDVPANYIAKDEFSIENNLFSAQWLYLTNEMVEQGVVPQIMSQFETQLNYSKAKKVSFISNSEEFSGKKYYLKGNVELKYKILAYGSVDGQPLLLNLGFKEDPKANENLDELMKKFILFKN